MMQLWASTPLERSLLLPELISSLLQWINMHDIITISSLLMLINILPFRTSTVYLILQRTILPHLKYEIAVLYFSQSLAFHGFRWHSGQIAHDWAVEDELCYIWIHLYFRRPQFRVHITHNTFCANVIPSWNPTSLEKRYFRLFILFFQEQLRKVIQIPEFIWKVFDCEIPNPGLWNPESSSRNPESRWWLEFGIQVPLTWNSKFNFPLITHLESRIQDCHG